LSFEPTAAQRRAITTMDRDVAVSAGAGSGKTKVLVERFVYLLEQGVSLQRLAAITFTRKAAQEMRDRIRAQLEEHPALSGLAPEMTHAQISTIHSLCQRMIAEHPRQARVDPRFRLGEEWEMDALLQECSEEVLQQYIDQGDPSVIEMREEYRRASEAAAMICGVYRRMASMGQRNFTQPDALSDLEAKFQRAQEQLCQTVSQLFAVWDEKTVAVTKLQEAKLTSFRRLWKREQPGLAVLPDPGVEEGCTLLAEALKGQWSKIKPWVIPVRESIQELSQTVLDWNGCCRMEAMVRVLNDLDAAYGRAKARQGLLDFNDLEQKALALLSAEEVKYHYDFEHLMVDEFQDTNRVQKAVVDGLRTDDTKLFVVGDGKQSIYRFRSAEVQVFLDTRREIEASGGIHISLADNFRSVPSLVAFSNRLFPYFMEGDRVAFEPSSSGRREERPVCAEKIVVEKSEGETINDGRWREAQEIANRIARLVTEEQRSYGDLALLFRASTSMKVYEQALQQRGIPFVNVSGRGFYSTREIQDMLSILDWIEDPDDMIAAAAVMRSPFFLVSDEGLYWYWSGEIERAAADDQRAAAEAEQLVRNLRRLAAHKPAPLIIRSLLNDTAFCERVSYDSLAAQRLANVMKLEETSWQLWSQGYVSLHEQRQYIRQILQGQDREGEARLDGEEADAVTIMTIHGAKGLEFPVVFLPDLNRALKLNRKPPVVYHQDVGMAYSKTTRGGQIADMIEQEEFEERKRLLYVAVTRAEDRVIFCGVEETPKADKTMPELGNWWQWLIKAEAEVFEEPLPVWEMTASPTAPLPEQRPKTKVEMAEYPGIPWQNQPRIEAPLDVVRFSVTSLLQYQECPRCYYYRYVLQVPDQPRGLEDTQAPPPGSGVAQPRSDGLKPTQRGSIIHRVCEHITDPDQLDDLLENALQLEGVSVDADERAELKEIAGRYLRGPSFARTQSAPVVREWPFILPLDAFSISGTVDQVILESDGALVTDFKTNAVDAEHAERAAERYRRQLELYAWALERLGTKPVHRLQIHFLLPDTVVEWPWHDGARADTARWLQRICMEIIERAERGSQAFVPAEGCRNSVGCRRAMETIEKGVEPM